MSDLLAAALEYAATGVHVFPARILVVDGHKRVTPIADWRNASTASPEVIRRWFGPGGAWESASLCVDCGKSGLVVVDVDEGPGRNGRANWAAAVAEHRVPTTPIRTSTPGGGEHWWYREHPRRIVGNSTSKIATDVDTRGLGGFVLAWPSRDVRGQYGRPDLGALAQLPVVPEFVVTRMNGAAPGRTDSDEGADQGKRPESHAERPKGADGTSVWDPPRPFTREQAEAFLRPHLEAFRGLRTPQDRGFNDALNNLACMYWHFVPAFYSTEQVTDLLFETAEHNRSVEWQGRRAVLETIRSGLMRGPRTGRWEAEQAPDQGGSARDSPGQGPEPALRRGDFTGVADRQRAEPKYLKRADHKAMLYPGKDSYLYAETESGKSWLVALLVTQCIADGTPVMVVDFEEGDEIEYGQRLLTLGMSEDQLNDPARFRYLMIDGRCTGEILAEADDMDAAVVVYEGMSVAYDVYGLQVKENDSATAFRRTLVKPHLIAGRAVLTTDHVVKDRDSRGRYAIGGVMKLNAASGGAFLLVNIEGLAPGRRGASNLYVTKDRPGGVKRHGVPAGEKFDPQVKRFGTLIVDDSRDFFSYLNVEVLAPAVDQDAGRDPLDVLAGHIVDVTRDSPGQSWASSRDLYRRLRLARISVRKDGDDLEVALMRLEARGEAERDPDPGPRRPRGGRLASQTRSTTDPSLDQLEGDP